MFSEFVGGFLGALGGVGVGAAALRFLASKLIEHRLTIALAEHQHGLDKQLETVKTQMDRLSDILSRRNEREFQVTEGAWERVIQAVGTAATETAARRLPILHTARAPQLLQEIDKAALVCPPARRPARAIHARRAARFLRGHSLSGAQSAPRSPSLCLAALQSMRTSLGGRRDRTANTLKARQSARSEPRS